MTSDTLTSSLSQILTSPKTLRDINDELAKSKIHVIVSGYLSGYLEALADNDIIYRKTMPGNRKVYSLEPIDDVAYRRCPYCARQLAVFDADVNTTMTCPKCMEEFRVEMSLGRGVILETIEVIE